MTFRRWTLLAGIGLFAVVLGLNASLQTRSVVAVEDRDLRIMSQNLYVGSGFSGIFGATSLPGLLAGAESDFQEVVASRFAERAEAMAAFIYSMQPDVIALQEVSLFRTGPANNPAPAETVFLDFQEVLQSALRTRGLSYNVVAVFNALEVELPKGVPPNQDVRLLDRDVILVRGDLRDLEVSNVTINRYLRQASVPSAAGPISFSRGSASIDLKLRGKSVRIVNSHLEVSAFSAIQAAQGQEMVAGTSNSSLPIILIGDFNSDAYGTSTPTYKNIIDAGFTDAWSTVKPTERGYTCCQAGNIRNETSAHRERIDVVLTKGNVRAVDAFLTGDKPSDRTASGLWPSDHAGILVDLVIGRGPAR